MNYGYDYEQDNDLTFIYICDLCSLKIVNYFCDLCPRYSYKIEDDEYIPIVTDKETFYIKNNMWKELINYSKIKKVKNFKSEECIITLDKSNFLSNCNHHYDFVSLMEWYVNKKTCPTCNRHLELHNCILDSNF